MPTLHWIGKDKIINHHQDVPYRILEKQYTYSNGEKSKEGSSENKIIHGDNLEALKSLLPKYEGKVDCIYIDPPYNTGKEGWVYNDKVNHPKIQKWLGEVVGKEGDDLSRHDKWLCMIYPRLKLLHKLLADDGVIYISIDDNEYHNLKTICDEIFEKRNFMTNFSWRTDGNFDNQAKIKINHEYILCYAKNFKNFKFPEKIDPNVEETSKLFKDSIVNTIIKNGIKNPPSKVKLPIGFPASFEQGIIKARNDSFPFFHEDAIVENHQLQNSVTVESGWSSKNFFELFTQNGMEPIFDTKGQKTRFYLTENGAIESKKERGVPSHVVSSLMNMGSTQNMSNELKHMRINFDFPKPTFLIQYLVSVAEGNKKNSIILDSFAGSGTTAHAILNLNKNDGGKRKFILIELEDYAENVTAYRTKKVISGYSSKKTKYPGTGGDFSYYSLGKPLFLENDLLNEEVAEIEIKKYVWYTETRSEFSIQTEPYLLGKNEDTAYYFFYEKERVTTLNESFLRGIKTKAEQYIIYADNCLLDKKLMDKYHIVFKKIPRDITRF